MHEAKSDYRVGYKGQCTWYAYGRFYEVNGIVLDFARNARDWLSDSQNKSNVKVVDLIQTRSIAVKKVARGACYVC